MVARLCFLHALYCDAHQIETLVRATHHLRFRPKIKMMMMLVVVVVVVFERFDEEETLTRERVLK